MKKSIILVLSILILCAAFTSSDGGKIAAISIKKLDGSKVNSSTFSNKGKPMVISFWATWCVPCKKELDAISKKYAKWQKETGVKLIAVSIDDARSSAKVVTMVKAKAWEYEVYLDENSDFLKAMKADNVPYTFLIDGKGKIVWSHNSYKEGDEDKLYENIQALAKGETIKH